MEGGEARWEVLLLGIPAIILILLNGGADLAIGGVASGPIQFTTDADTAFLVSFVLGVLLFFALVLYWVTDDPTARSFSATILILFGSFSLWAGGGFLVGSVLAVIAGVIGVVFAYAPLPPETPWVPTPSYRHDEDPTTASLSPTPPSDDLPARSSEPTIVRYCPKCDSKNSVNARACQQCGAALAPADSTSAVKD
jgi:hypothetical protein